MQITMNDEQEVQRLEILCKQLYESQDTTLRSEAEASLIQFQESGNNLGKCQMLLERANSSYSQLLATTALSKLIMRSNQCLDIQQRIDIRNYVLNYLATRMKLQHYVVQALVSLFAKITKIGWFDSYKGEFVFRNVIEDISKFLAGSIEHSVIGVQLLAELTSEMNQISELDANRSLTRHRRIASSFRDLQLLEIFRLSCSLLKNTSENCNRINFDDENHHGVVTQLLKLTLNCLSFDFIGTSADDSSDDLCTVQIPTSWRSVFLDQSTLELFFSLYHALPPAISALALSCLVQLSSVRRSLFNNTERAKFLKQLMTGVRNILVNPISLSETSNYHEFCRLLSRLKANYQLGELVVVENYPETLQLIAKFTIESLQMWQFAPNSVHYLLSLWQRMVVSVPYVKSNEPHLLDTYTPEITKAYIASRLESVPVIISKLEILISYLRDNLEDPLDDLGMINQQLEQLSLIGRCDYQKTCAVLISYFDQSANAYQDLISKCSPESSSIDIRIQENRLAWLVYMIGAAIQGRGTLNNQEDHDTMDGELICRVLQLMNLTDSRLAQSGCEKLELAMLSFFDSFRKIYVGEQVQKNSKVYKTFSDILGLNEESAVLSVFIRKIITNLKYWNRSELIINKTLQLLNDLSMGYSCVRKLVKLEEVEFLLNNHSGEHFPLLGNSISVPEMRCRSSFYTSLGRLLLIELGEDDNKFQTFIAPLTASFEKITSMLSNGKSSIFSDEDTKMALIGLARDIRGFVYSLNTRTSYMMFFDWIYPNYLQLLLRAVEVWYYDPQVTTPILKLYSELVQNRSQRLQFDVSSPNGILLFREVSKIICTYGSRILNVEIQKSQIYNMKVKGISICFSMLKAALCGSYVNFGVFRLYGDDCLDNSLKMFITLLLSISKTDLLEYPKLSQAYYTLLECLAQDHMSFLSTLEPQVFLYILTSITDGLSALDTLICTGCCSTLDHIVTYLFKLATLKVDVLSGKKPPSVMPAGAEMFLKVLEANSEILQQLLQTVLNVIIFEDCRNQWSMSRPLLGLILVNEDHFNKMRQEIIRNQPTEKQASMAQWFDHLMEGIERNLLTKNRDKFTHNLCRFRQEINESIKNSNENTVSIQDMMTISYST